MKNFYHFFIIEDIQVEAASMSLELVYPFWESTRNYVDTGEVIGLVTTPQKDASASDEVVDGEEEGGDSDDEVGGREEFYGDGLTPSARCV